MRKAAALVVLLLLLCAHALGAEDPANLAFVSQRDPALGSLPYWTDTYRESGCSPASIANAVIAALGVDDPEESIPLAAELLRLMSPRQEPAGHQISTQALRYLALSPEARAASWSDYPVLGGLLDAWPGTILQGQITGGSAARAAMGSLFPLLLMADNVSMADLSPIVAALDELHRLGVDDARLILGRVAVGALHGATPLSYGENGHFMTLLFNVGEYSEHGTVYSVDSLPRSLGPAEDARYTGRYTFAIDHWITYRELSRFHCLWQAERVSDTVLRLTPTPEAAAATEAWRAGSGADPRPADLRRLGLFGKCLAFLVLP